MGYHERSAEPSTVPEKTIEHPLFLNIFRQNHVILNENSGHSYFFMCYLKGPGFNHIGTYL